MQDYIRHGRGRLPERRELTAEALAQYGARPAYGILQEVYDFASNMLEMKVKNKAP